MTVTMTMEEYTALSEKAKLADKAQDTAIFWRGHSDATNKERLEYQAEVERLIRFICDSTDVSFDEANRIADGTLNAESLWEQRKSTFEKPDEDDAEMDGKKVNVHEA